VDGQATLDTARSPPLVCPGSCDEKWKEELHRATKRQATEYPYTYAKPEHRREGTHSLFQDGSLPTHWWQLPYDSTKFWDDEQVPQLAPMASYPYLTSLDVSPDEQHLAWVSPGGLQEFEIVIYSTTTCTEVLRLPYSAPMRWPSHLEPSCLFVGSDRILVVNQQKSYTKDGIDEVRLALYDVIKGAKLAAVGIPNCSFRNATIRHNTKTIAAEKESSFHLLVCEAADDNLTYTTLKADQILAPGPRFGPDGKLYVMSMDGLCRIEDGNKEWVMDGAHCVCFLGSGKACCGGGYGDFSGDSALQIGDLNTWESYSIPWGRIPIQQIQLAGNDDILTANQVAGFSHGAGRFAFVSLFSLSDKRTRWAVKLDALAQWRSPLLLSSPEERWALVTTGLSIRRISLPAGKSMQMIPTQPEEFVEAMWLPSKRLLCIPRNPNERIRGRLELYSI
jgi:hypothetical protein